MGWRSGPAVRPAAKVPAATRRSPSGALVDAAAQLRLEPAFGGLLPHAPILIPAVAGERLALCRRSHAACSTLARRCVATAPARLVLVSPHAPRRGRGFGLTHGAQVRGNLDEFAAPTAAVDLPGDPAAAAAVERVAGARGLATWRIQPAALDHGSLVPLWFLAEAGWNGPTLVLSLPDEVTPHALQAFGAALADALAGLAGRPAFVASGDLSHRAAPRAPAGFDPRGARFDRDLTDRIASGRLAELRTIDPGVRAAACEDAIDPLTLVCAALGSRTRGAEVLGYEHPFGVGYLAAVLHDGGAP